MIRLFRVSFPPSIVALFLVEAFLAVGSYVLTFQLRGEEDWALWLLYEGGLDRVGLVVASILLGIYFNDLYSEVRVTSRVWLVQKFCLVFGLAFMAQALLSYVNPELILGRWHMILGSGIALVVLPAWRIAFDALVLRMLPSRTILFVGAGDLVRTVAGQLQRSPHFAMTGIGYLEEQPVGEASEGLGPHLGTPGDLKEVAGRLKPDTIVVGLDERRSQLPVDDLLELNITGTKVEEITSLYENVMWRVPVQALRPSQMLFSGGFGPNENSILLQRVYSFLIALVGVLAFAPVMLVVWLLVRLTSRGPAIYSQRRVGLKGREFQVYKFRSMYVDAEARTGAVWAAKADPRITPLGRWLRKLRLDELPQFFNVLKGDMNIVGPRPEQPVIFDSLREELSHYPERQRVLPGITGLAQVRLGYDQGIDDVKKKVALDLEYIRNRSAVEDLMIMAKTMPVMVLRKGWM